MGFLTGALCPVLTSCQDIFWPQTVTGLVFGSEVDKLVCLLLLECYTWEHCRIPSLRQIVRKPQCGRRLCQLDALVAHKWAEHPQCVIRKVIILAIFWSQMLDFLCPVLYQMRVFRLFLWTYFYHQFCLFLGQFLLHYLKFPRAGLLVVPAATWLQMCLSLRFWLWWVHTPIP